MTIPTFPPCEPSIIEEVSRGVDLPPCGPLYGVPNTESFGRFYWKCVDFLKANQKRFMERGYMLFHVAPLEWETQESRIGLVRTTNPLEVVAIMGSGANETPTEKVIEFLGKLMKEHQIEFWSIGRWDITGTLDPHIVNAEAYAEEVAMLCPHKIYRKKKAFIEHITMYPMQLSLQWDHLELRKKKRK